MRAEPAYRIDVEGDDLVVRVRRGVLDQEQVSRFLDSLELETIRRRSQLSEADARALADEIDRGVWERVRHSRFCRRASLAQHQRAKVRVRSAGWAKVQSGA